MSQARFPRTSWRALPLVLVTLMASVPVDAQWTRRSSPADSPDWWTLTDEVRPSELRRQLQDADLIRARFRRAAETGVLQEEVTEQQIQQVSSFIDGRLHPELVPMYLAFTAFSGRFDHRSGWSEQGPLLLKEYDITPRGVQQLLEGVSRYQEQFENIVAEVTPPVAELMALLRPLVDEVGNEKLVDMLVEEDFSGLARLTGGDAAAIARLQRAWKREPNVEAASPVLVELREQLSTNDWNAFRRFLLAEVAPLMGGVDYREDR